MLNEEEISTVYMYIITVTLLRKIRNCRVRRQINIHHRQVLDIRLQKLKKGRRDRRAPYPWTGKCFNLVQAAHEVCPVYKWLSNTNNFFLVATHISAALNVLNFIHARLLVEQHFKTSIKISIV